MIGLELVSRLLKGVLALGLSVPYGRQHLRGTQSIDTSQGAAPVDLASCFKDQTLTWNSVDGELRVNDRVFHLKGVNWFGFETDKYALHGLDIRSIDEYFGFLREHGFNALRIPFSLAFAKSYNEPVTSMPFRDAALHGLTRRDLLNLVIRKAADNRILVMLDLHRLNDQFIPQLWYSPDNSIQDVLSGWDVVLEDVKQHFNVFAIDIKNEPFGVATWAKPATDWNVAASHMASYLLTNHPDFKGLVFIEGINYSTDFRGWKKFPIDLGKSEFNERMVLSPHQYGPSVVMLPLFTNESFPENMPQVWWNHWAFAEEVTGRAVVLGEWGGHYVGLDRVWGDAFATFLVDNCLSDQFHWCLNPDSGDTGGLLKEDWVTPESAKLKLLEFVQPHPSYLYKDEVSGAICLEPGQYANPDCKSSQSK